MIKNKDGSYNKFSLLLLALIVITVIGVIGSIILQTPETPVIDTTFGIIIIIIIVTGLSGLYFRFIKKSNKIIPSTIHTTVSSPALKQIRDHIEIEKPIMVSKQTYPIQEKIELINTPEQIEKPVQRGSSINLISLVITLIIAAVTMTVGVVVVNSLINSMPELPVGSPFATSQTEVLTTISSTFNIIPLFLIIGAVIMIIALMSRVVINN